MHRRFIALLVILTSACAGNPPGESTPRGVDRNLLTRQEMLDRNFVNVYDAVEALRNQWLLVRGFNSFEKPSQVWVYMDNVRLGDVESLRGVAVNTIRSVRHLGPNEATARWGVGHTAGAILVETMSSSPPTPPPPEAAQAGARSRAVRASAALRS
jgi:hypothetical protein